MNVDFVDWLQAELEIRGWSRSELIRRGRANGHKLTTSQLSRLMSREQEGTVAVIVAIASGLSLSREEVFRARGWLPSQTEKESELKLSPEVAEVAAEIEQLPLESRRIVLHVARSTAEVLREEVGR